MNRQRKRFRFWPTLLFVVTAILVSHLSASVRGEIPGSSSAAADQNASHPLDPALKHAHDSLKHSQTDIQDYTAILFKRLRIKGELQKHQTMFVKVRNHKMENGRLATPLSVYLRFLNPESVKGREVIWVEGQNAGKIIAHETGFKNLLRVHLEPTGFIAMRNQRYPVTDIGLENLVVKLIETGRRDRKYGECDVQFFRNTKVGNRACTTIQVIHPVKRSHFDFYCARVYFDNELNLPIRYESWSWPHETGGRPVLQEEYTYTDVRVNVGLTYRDFDPDNTNYDYP